LLQGAARELFNKLAEGEQPEKSSGGDSSGEKKPSSSSSSDKSSTSKPPASSAPKQQAGQQHPPPMPMQSGMNMAIIHCGSDCLNLTADGVCGLPSVSLMQPGPGDPNLQCRQFKSSVAATGNYEQAMAMDPMAAGGAAPPPAGGQPGVGAPAPQQPPPMSGGQPGGSMGGPPMV